MASIYLDLEVLSSSGSIFRNVATWSRKLLSPFASLPSLLTKPAVESSAAPRIFDWKVSQLLPRWYVAFSHSPSDEFSSWLSQMQTSTRTLAKKLSLSTHSIRVLSIRQRFPPKDLSWFSRWQNQVFYSLIRCKSLSCSPLQQQHRENWSRPFYKDGG